jgi:hypothetical protein
MTVTDDVNQDRVSKLLFTIQHDNENQEPKLTEDWNKEASEIEF